MKLLVTGGAGYIGTHTCVELLSQDHQVVVIDNLSNSSPIALERVATITEKQLITSPLSKGDLVLNKADIRDRNALQQIFENHKIDAVIHLAGLKAVGESVEKPLVYYNNNVTGTITLLEEMASANINTFIFSSSATVYGDPATVPIKEDFPTGVTTNPYGQSKYFIEEILKDIHRADTKWKIGLLRYFNPVGAHPSGLIGEDPNGIPGNLMPYISQVAVGKRNKLKIFGSDYPTKDGTGVRDYIHVVDLAKGHLAALKYLTKSPISTIHNPLITNLGTGKGNSVIEMVNGFEKASGRKIPYEIVERRAGDIAECWASTEYAKQHLDWEAQYNLQRMCEDSWRWQQQNPNGYSY
jgi:UDP-glucose 4-epimerase